MIRLLNMYSIQFFIVLRISYTSLCSPCLRGVKYKAEFPDLAKTAETAQNTIDVCMANEPMPSNGRPENGAKGLIDG
jgi:hypothetical protein